MYCLSSVQMSSSGSSIIQVTRVDGGIYSSASPYSHSLPLPEWPSRTSNILNPNTAKYETMNQFRWVSNDLFSYDARPDLEAFLWASV